ncbi:SNF2 family N-terminal domain-containing protein [Echria macrotheca]|uniref:SNF2 family N-terminal domain-containing protein n=1 Tax=Echria macrotheca TaxID=438768 RepID=A0AAJ0BH93_9PEZI|nr:SNF2 family N-terminal domain-containing protein [Echria macrotheca]
MERKRHLSPPPKTPTPKRRPIYAATDTCSPRPPSSSLYPALPPSLSPSPSSFGALSSQESPIPSPFATETDQDLWPSKTEEACFGTINGVQVMLKWPPKAAQVSSRDNQEPGSSVQTLLLQFYDGCCLLVTEGGDVVGVLEDRALRPLAALSSGCPPIKCEAVVSEAVWKSQIQLVDGRARNGQQITVDVDVFGPLARADDVARQLGRMSLFLQTPSRHDMFIPPYFNPQCLVLPEVTSSSTAATFAAGTGNEKADLLVQQSLHPNEDHASNLDEPVLDLDHVMKGVRQFHGSGVLHIDSRIKTKLLPDQKKGVQFILQREKVDQPDEMSLWDRIECDEGGIIGFRHAITGAKSQSTDDALGGILADDMGLGKTLTMLSAIIMSTPLANEFARTNDRMNVDGPKELAPRYSKATLVVVPSELLLVGWAEEIKKHMRPGSISHCKYHGKNRHTANPDLSDYDIVLTTYGTVAADFTRQRNVLRGVYWYRVVLDEAHIIRNSSTKHFRAVRSIPAHMRWCITGTPIQNSLDDLGALTRFLDLPILSDVHNFRRFISAEAAPSQPGQKPDFTNLQLLLGSICIRRQQSFPSKTEIIRPEFSATEKKDYDTLAVVCKQALEAAVNARNSAASHQNVLKKLLRLREFCNGITASNDNDPEHVFSLFQQSGDACCSYCSIDIPDLDTGAGEEAGGIIITECQKLVCSDLECISQYHDALEACSDGQRRCPFCKLEHVTENLLVGQRSRENANTASTPPSKLRVLLENVMEHMDKDKCIIFSVWKGTLDIVGEMLNAKGVAYSRVDGSVSTMTKRKGILLDFQRRPNLRVLLMTLGTGAVGLNNLSVANRIHLLEPQWNPSVERQAIGRILRLGQDREVKIIRYIMKNSIEELVEKHQRRKNQIASGGFNFAHLAKHDCFGAA